jgi:hypothetical protein
LPRYASANVTKTEVNFRFYRFLLDQQHCGKDRDSGENCDQNNENRYEKGGWGLCGASDRTNGAIDIGFVKGNATVPAAL